MYTGNVIEKFENFIRVAAATPEIRLADCKHNAEAILSLIKRAAKEEVHLLVLPEFCITGATCGDLHSQNILLDEALNALSYLIQESRGYNVLVIVGTPLRTNGKPCNAMAVLLNGKLLHLVTSKDERIVFSCNKFSMAIGQTATDAMIIAHPNSRFDVIGSADRRRDAARYISARLCCAYIHATPGLGESTTDFVYSGHNIISENGVILQESPPFGDGWAVSEIDLGGLDYERRNRKINPLDVPNCRIVDFEMEVGCKNLTRKIDPQPFITGVDFQEVINIQAAGLRHRLKHANFKKAVIGISGGMDSALATLVAAEAVKGTSAEILAYTMPCFGTSERTRKNAHALCKAIGVECHEIDITGSVKQHLKEISHTSESDITYENAQARMRTLTLMDIANREGGLMIGPGSLSELALGWTTFNGDHMSMYAVNSGVPKTLIGNMLGCIAKTCNNPELSAVLEDILNTPISPELLPNQKTEDTLGSYELHDFFLYHMLCKGRRPKEIFQLAGVAFDYGHGSVYYKDEILRYLKIFCSRFFSQQFKRNCIPDGPRVGAISLSPRGGFSMPSDASVAMWMGDLEEM